MSQEKPLTIIVRCTYSCNLDCEYCYVKRAPRKKETISLRTSLNLIKQACVNFPERPIHFIWHGGEPLLLGVKFFGEIFAYQKRFKKKNIRNSVQSNSILVNDNYLNLFSKYKVSIGTSLDGGEDLNDKSRRNTKGSRYFSLLCKKINIIREAFGHAGAICVVGKYNTNMNNDIYNIYKRIGLELQLMPTKPIYNPSSKDMLNKNELICNQYGKFLVEVLKIWVNDPEPVLIVNFNEYLRSYLGESNLFCMHSNNCFDSFLAIDTNGDVYPCCSFIGHKELLYGNINKTSLNRIMLSDVHRTYANGTKDLPGPCYKCRYLNWCRGGCPFLRWDPKKNDFRSVDSYCADYRYFFNAFSKIVKQYMNQ